MKDQAEITLSNIRTALDSENIALARQLAMFLSKELTNASLANIGTHIGVRDHSTVIHACKNIEKKIQADGDFKLRIHNIKNQISE